MILQKEIYWANLDPTKDSEQAGVRPVVVVSGNAMNRNLRVCIVCPLSSHIKGYVASTPVQKNKTNRLKVDSEVLAFQVRTISQSRLTKKIGVISTDQLRNIIYQIGNLFQH